MGRIKQNKPRRVRNPQPIGTGLRPTFDGEELPPLVNSPARTLLMLTAKGEDDEAARDILINWPYRVYAGGQAGGITSIKEIAQDPEVGGPDAGAQSLVTLEDEGAMTWDSQRNGYILGTPETVSWPVDETPH